MINRGGENVYCVEVENALAGAPGVGEAAVVGVPDDDDGREGRRGDRAAAGAAVRRRGDPRPTWRERLADFKVPQYVALRSEPLPRNPGGKVLKRHLRDGTEWGSPLR